ncbi:MAG: pyridoxamine 5'-phosphate oxidase family protein [Proteobacteria bacterium]|nr:pyridoxamine 5'-phosphate oxidase family protein [Pseudomonadota bacterium]
MITWKQFAASAPKLAQTGLKHLYHPEQGEVGLLATVNAEGLPSIAPVCPIFADDGVYLLVAAASPKRRHLDQHGAYALHAQVGAPPPGPADLPQRRALTSLTSSLHVEIFASLKDSSDQANL